jgi:AraC-like DNA-binding protein
MSKKRQLATRTLDAADRDDQVRTYSVRYPSGYVIPSHTHEWHQLIYGSIGVMTVTTAKGTWVIPPHRAVWVPAGVEHAIELSGSVLMQSLYLAADVSAALPAECCAVNVSPLLRELIAHIATPEFPERPPAVRARLLGVLLDQLEVLPTIPLQLPLPRDPRAVRVAEWLREHPDAPGLLKQMARRSGASVRTVERLFQLETGMTFGKWRQQLRLLHALRQLATGRPVTAVALEVGYDSPSAFIAMFRAALGMTPTRYFATPGKVPASDGRPASHRRQRSD